MGLDSILSFFTVIPSRASSLQEIAKWSFLAPILIGTIAGVLDFLVYYATLQLLNSILAGSLLTFAFIETFRGFNHLDGLLDMGDAIMVRGDRETRLRALKDVAVGAGGIGTLLVYSSLMIAAMIQVQRGILGFLSLLSVEVLARSEGLLLLALVPPIPESSLGKTFHRELKRRYPAILIQSFPFLLSPTVSLLFALTLILFQQISARTIGGSSGDSAGMTITLSFPILLIAEVKWPCFWFSYLHWP
jgi:adenosylcobinamide-GDP ribazoletransferase